jgi:uncharacterized protein YbjT (DUF2867 family)
MATILVTGATGTLGRPTVLALRERGHDIRELSRRPGTNATGDLLEPTTLPAVLAGVDTVVHLSTGKRDVEAATNLIAAATDAHVSHLVLISIVGIERVPYAYYVAKVAIEKSVVDSGIAYTILRATQFHQFIERLLTAQRALPVVFAPSFSLQPVTVEEVAARLAELAVAAPAGRVADLGGPEKREAGDLARAWKRAAGIRRPIVPLRLPGTLFRAWRAGYGMTEAASGGGVGTFDEYLATKYGARA